jgi:hypothetical protein
MTYALAEAALRCPATSHCSVAMFAAGPSTRAFQSAARARVTMTTIGMTMTTIGTTTRRSHELATDIHGTEGWNERARVSPAVELKDVFDCALRR